MDEQKPVKVFPRRLARKLAKARTGMNELSKIDWRRAAADQAKTKFKKGAPKK